MENIAVREVPKVMHYSIRMNATGVKRRIVRSQKSAGEFRGDIHIRWEIELKGKCYKSYDTTSLRANPRKASAKSTRA